MERELGVGEQHRDLGPGERDGAAATFGDFAVVGQELDRAVELVALLQRLHQPLLESEVVEPALLVERDRERLLVIVAQHEGRDLVGHAGEQRIAVGPGQVAVVQRQAQRDLEVDLDVGGVDAGGIVDRIGVEADAAERRLDAAALGHAEIGAFADHLAAERGADGADRVVGAVADRLVAFARRAHIGADAAEPEKVDRRLEDRLHDLLGRRMCRGEAEHAPAPAD